MTITKRRIGDRDVYPIGLGCMNVTHAYGPPIDETDAKALFVRALDRGCDFLDTATLYGAGRSEELIGESLGHRRKEYFLASKCVLGFRDGQRVLDARPEAIKAACEASLKRLRTDVIDLYYLHRPDPQVPIEDSAGALSELVAAGKIRYIGLSEMSAGQLRRAHAIHPVTAMQSEYSLWARNPEIAVLDACNELGTVLVAYSPLGRGFFADPPPDPEQFHMADIRRMIFPRFTAEFYPKNLSLLTEAKSIAREAGCSVAQLALAWTLAKGKNVIPIPGTTKPSHFDENHAAGAVSLSAALVNRLDAHFAPDRIAGNRYTTAVQASVTTEMYDFEKQAHGG